MIGVKSTLLLAGLLAGLIQYFVIFKGLPQEQAKTSTNESFSTPNKWIIFYNFIKAHWQFFGYLTVGVAGSFMTPLIYEMVGGRLSGLDEFKKHFVDSGKEPNTWDYLILFGYGIVFGYSCVRIIGSIGSLIIGNLALKQTDQQKQLEANKKEIEELKNKLSAVPLSTTPKTTTTIHEGLADNFNDDAYAALEMKTFELAGGCEENPNPKLWKDWRTAESLKTLLKQINAMAPNRNKDSDGTIGDLTHQSGDSDHNPHVWDSAKKTGVVTALDITHDPGKCNCQLIANSLHDNQDPRIKYVIWNSQIMNSAAIDGTAPWSWRPYKGKNPHNKHIHISVKCDKESYDSIKEWNVKIS